MNNLDDIYKQKYLKYKQKYLDLKNNLDNSLFGGNKEIYEQKVTLKDKTLGIFGIFSRVVPTSINKTGTFYLYSRNNINILNISKREYNEDSIYKNIYSKYPIIYFILTNITDISEFYLYLQDNKCLYYIRKDNTRNVDVDTWEITITYIASFDAYSDKILATINKVRYDEYTINGGIYDEYLMIQYNGKITVSSDGDKIYKFNIINYK